VSGRLFDLLAWLELNKKLLLYCALGAVAIGFVAFAYNLSREQAELKASSALLELRTPLGGEETAKPPAAADFLRLAKEFSGTDSGARAALLAAGALFEEGKYAEARNQFEKFLSQTGEGPFAPTAAYGVAVCLDALDKTNEALAAYQGVLNRYPKAPVAAQANLALARLYEASNQPEQALKIYEYLSRSDNVSPWSSDAAERREYLLLKHPHLAEAKATNAPGAAINAPSASLPAGAANPPVAATTPPTDPSAGAAKNP
jgi:predicted negative regulator of RcsB-dependent stress response